MKNFTRVPNRILKDSSLSNGEFRILVLLFSFKYGKNEVYPSQKYLANIVDVDRKTISNHLRALKRKKYLSWKRRTGTSNIYIFPWERNFPSVEKQFSQNYGNIIPTSNNTRNKKIEKNKIHNPETESIKEVLKRRFLQVDIDGT